MSTRVTRALSCLVSVVLAASAVAQEAQPAAAEKPFKEEEIAALLAPIALYPDQVLAQILMASTYPLEVVQACRWLEQNGSLQGEALAAAAKGQPWDESVQALTALPDVLEMMDQQLDWTQQLGDAFLAQQQDVMAMVQTLRKDAQKHGSLRSDEHQTVSLEASPESGGVVTSSTVIVIQPTNPEVVYVPSYSPTVVYGTWWYSAYPPYSFPPPAGYRPGAGLAWGVGVAVGVGVWHEVWDDHCDWHGGDITIDRDITINRGDVNIGSGNTDVGGGRSQAQAASATSRSGQSWSHDPEHRKGTSYRNPDTAQRYGGSAAAVQTSASDAYRGRTASVASAATSPAGGGASPALAGGSLGAASRAGGSTAALSGGNLAAGSSRVDLGAGGGTASVSSVGGGAGSGGGRQVAQIGGGSGSGGGGAAAAAGGWSVQAAQGGVYAGMTVQDRAAHGGAYGGMSSGAQASSYSARGAASRSSAGVVRAGGGRR